MDDDEIAFKEKQKAGMFLFLVLLCLDRLTDCFALF